MELKKLELKLKYLDDKNSDMSLVITGGLRLSSDFAKALAMGANYVMIGSLFSKLIESAAPTFYYGNDGISYSKCRYTVRMLLIRVFAVVTQYWLYKYSR